MWTIFIDVGEKVRSQESDAATNFLTKTQSLQFFRKLLVIISCMKNQFGGNNCFSFPEFAISLL